jgi:hypothetical protein
MQGETLGIKDAKCGKLHDLYRKFSNSREIKYR